MWNELYGNVPVFRFSETPHGFYGRREEERWKLLFIFNNSQASGHLKKPSSLCPKAGPSPISPTSLCSFMTLSSRHLWSSSNSANSAEAAVKGWEQMERAVGAHLLCLWGQVQPWGWGLGLFQYTCSHCSVSRNTDRSVLLPARSVEGIIYSAPTKLALALGL